MSRLHTVYIKSFWTVHFQLFEPFIFTPADRSLLSKTVNFWLSPQTRHRAQKMFWLLIQLLADQEAEMEANLEKMLKNEDETEDKATKSSGKDNSTPPKENVQNHKIKIFYEISRFRFD